MSGNFDSYPNMHSTYGCCCRPTPPACSCGGVRQPNYYRETLPGVSSTWPAEAPLSRETSKGPVCCLRYIGVCSWIGGLWYVGVFYIGGREGRYGVFRRLCVGMILGWDFYWFYATVIMYVLCSLLCKVEEENRLEEYGLFIPILQSDWTLRIMREGFCCFWPDSSNVWVHRVQES